VKQNLMTASTFFSILGLSGIKAPVVEC